MQVDRRHHAEGRDDDRHQDHHEDGAEDGREYTAFRVGLARLTRDELAYLMEPVAHLGRQSHGVGPGHIQYLGHGHGHQLATHVLDCDGITIRLGTQGKEFLFQYLIAVVECLALFDQLGFKLIGQLIIELGLALFETQLLQLVVD